MLLRDLLWKQIIGIRSVTHSFNLKFDDQQTRSFIIGFLFISDKNILEVK